MRKRTIRKNLRPNRARLVLMTKSSKRRILSNLGKMCDGSCLQKPRRAVMILIVARQARKARSVQPLKVFCEPLFQAGEVCLIKGFRVAQKQQTLNNFGQMHSLDHTFGAARLRGQNGLAVENAWRHACRGIEKPGPQMDDCLLSISSLVSEHKGRCEGGNPDAELEQRVTMSSEGVGIRRAAAAYDVRARGVSRVGPVVVGFGVVVVRSAGTARAGQR